MILLLKGFTEKDINLSWGVSLSDAFKFIVSVNTYSEIIVVNVALAIMRFSCEVLLPYFNRVWMSQKQRSAYFLMVPLGTTLTRNKALIGNRAFIIFWEIAEYAN